MILYIISFFTALALSLAFTPLMRSVAHKYGIIDAPTTSVKTHKSSVAYLGGVAIWLSFIITMVTVRFLTHFPTGTLRDLRGLVFGGTVIMIVGLLDDMKGFSYKSKFLGQLLATLLLMVFDIRMKFIDSYALSFIFTLLWVVGVTNAFNIIDIMDGLSGGVAIMAALAFFFVALPTEQIYVNFASCIIAGSCLGFLKYNWSPAKIFMGDAGSLFIGFIMAAMALGENYTSVNNLALFTPVLILGVPIFDTLLVMAMRLRSGKSVFLGSKDHFALRLEAMGFTRKKIVLLAYLLSAFLGIMAFLITIAKLDMAVLIYLLVAFLAFIFATKLSAVKVR